MEAFRRPGSTTKTETPTTQRPIAPIVDILSAAPIPGFGGEDQ